MSFLAAVNDKRKKISDKQNCAFSNLPGTLAGNKELGFAYGTKNFSCE